MDTQAEIERLKALVAATDCRTTQVNAYADRLAEEYGRKEKEASELRKQIASLKASMKPENSVNN